MCGKREISRSRQIVSQLIIKTLSYAVCFLASEAPLEKVCCNRQISFVFGFFNCNCKSSLLPGIFYRAYTSRVLRKLRWVLSFEAIFRIVLMAYEKVT